MRPSGLGVSYVNVMCDSTREQKHIVHYKARSLLPKVYERAVCVATKPDIICIVETWLDDSISDNDLSLSNYQLFRLDRNYRHGGGIAVYVHCLFSCKVLLKGGPFALEFISIFLYYITTIILFCLCLIYCPPSSPVSIFDDLLTTLRIVNPAGFSNFIIAGDFNVNSNHSLFSHIQDTLLRVSLTQVVSSHTHSYQSIRKPPITV